MNNYWVSDLQAVLCVCLCVRERKRERRMVQLERGLGQCVNTCCLCWIDSNSIVGDNSACFCRNFELSLCHKHSHMLHVDTG